LDSFPAPAARKGCHAPSERLPLARHHANQVNSPRARVKRRRQ